MRPSTNSGVVIRLLLTADGLVKLSFVLSVYAISSQQFGRLQRNGGKLYVPVELLVKYSRLTSVIVEVIIESLPHEIRIVKGKECQI
jgi:hypothetical protein